MKRSHRAKHLTALLLATALGIGMLSPVAFANTTFRDPFSISIGSTLFDEFCRIDSLESSAERYDAYLALCQRYPDIPSIHYERIDCLESSSEKYSAYLALCQQYPDIPSVHYKLADFMYSYNYDRASIIRELETVIQLSETYQGWDDEPLTLLTLMLSSYDSYDKFSMQSAAYELEAKIYLDDLQQDAYLSAMRNSLQVQENDLRQHISDDVTRQILSIRNGEIELAPGANIIVVMDHFGYWNYVLTSLREIKAKQKELDRIEAWYQAGSSRNFSAWDDWVTVNESNEGKRLTVSIQCSPTASISIPSVIYKDGYTISSFRSPSKPVSMIQLEYDFQKPDSVSGILRSFNGVHFLYSTGLSHSAEIICYTDGTQERIESSSCGFDFCDLTKFCTVQELELPDIVREYASTEYSDANQHHSGIGYWATCQYVR